MRKKSAEFQLPVAFQWSFVLSALFLLLFSGRELRAQINVTNTNNANTLAQKLVGEGVAISNATIQCEQNQSGLFVAVASNLPEDSGIVLTTGLAGSAFPSWGVNGPAANLANFNQGNLGDAVLTALAGTSTFDRCILEFDFKANGDSIFFKYVFGSEEYPQFNCTAYNDVFGFFISGPGYPTPVNLALVPGTNIPVAINSINNGTIPPGGALSNCTTMGPGSPFTSLYVDNSAGTTVIYNGFTQLLTAKAAITPCSTYHLKLAIADGYDHILDSGVFLKAGSLTSNTFKLKVTTDSMANGIPYVFEGCDTAVIKIKRRLFQTNVGADTVTLVVTGTATSGADYPALQTTHYFTNSISDTEKTLLLIPINDLINEGTESVKIKIFDQCQIAIDSIQIDIKDPPRFTFFNSDTTICLGKSVSIAGTYSPGLSFAWSPTTGVVSPGIFNAVITPPATTSYILTATYPGCVPFKDTINIAVQPLPTISLSPTNVLCNGLTTGSITATGTAVTLPISFTLNPPGVSLSGSPANFANLGAGTYTVTVTSGFGCTQTASTTITQPSAILWGSVNGSNIACNGGNIGTITASASGGNGALSYTLVPGNITNATGSFSGLGSGTYTISAKDANNCSITSQVVITQTQGLTWVNMNITNIACNGLTTGAINLGVSGGSGTITYTMQPGAVVNTIGIFSALAAGAYTINAVDANGCTAQTVVNVSQPPLITFPAPTITQPTCNGFSNGSITIVAQGGVPTYTYTRTPGNVTNTNGNFTGLVAGAYTISVTDASGCTKTTVVNVTQPNPVVINSVATVIPNCVPGNNGSIVVSAGGGTPALYYKINNNAYQGSSSFTGLGSGIYTVTVSDNVGCTASSIVNLVTPNSPVLSNATNPLTCANSIGVISVSATNGIGPYTYTLMPGNISNGTGQFPGITAGTYTVTVSGQNGCTASMVINLIQPPSLNWASFNLTQIPCTGIGTGSLASLANGGTNPVTYVLSPGNQTNTNGNFTGLAANSYTITATDANGCSVTSAFTVSVLQAVTITTATHNNVTCNGQNNGSIQVTATGAGTLSYTLQPGTVVTSNGFYPNMAAGSYTITASDGGPCPTSTVIVITQPPVINITNISSTAPSCIPGADGSITITANGGNSPYSYSVNNGPQQASNTFLNLSIAVYTVKVTDASGCTKTSVFSLTNPLAPSFTSLTSNQVACAGAASGTVTAIVTGGVGTINYTINPLGLSNTSGIFSNLPVNVYTVTASDANGCAITSTIAINQPSQINWSSVTGTNITCNAASNGQINALASGGVATYNYSVNPGGITNTSGSFNALGPNTYTVTVSDANGCTLTSTVSITQPPVLAWLSVGKTNACNNVLGSITATLNGGTPFYSFTLQPGALNNTNGSFTGLNPNTYTLTGTDANGCTVSTTLLVQQSPLIVMNSLTNTVPSCNPGNNATITAAASGGANPLLYNLNGGINQASGVFNGIGVSVYTIQVTDAIGCTISSTINVSNPASPSISSTNATAILCYGQQTSTLTTVAGGGTGTLTYALTPGILSNTTGIFPSIGANNYTVTVTDANNCSATTNFILSQPPLLIWDSVDNRDVSCFGGSNGLVTSSASGGTGLITYTLTPPGISNISGAFFGLGVGAYTLTATDSNGCVISSAFLINQAPPIVWTTATSTPPSCVGLSNGSITAMASGGNGSFEYTLQPGAVLNTTGLFPNLAAGSYTVTAKDAKSCTLTTVITVLAPLPVSLGNVSTTLASCNPGCDGTATVSASGGTGTFTYSLNGAPFQAGTGFASLCAAVYTVTVMDGNNCTGTGTFSITTANGPTAISVPVTPITCNGLVNGSLSTSVTGGTGTINYQLQPGNVANTTGSFTGLGVNVYTITATDANGCTISTTASMTQPFPLLLTNTSVTNVSCFGGNNGGVSTQAVGGNGGYAYTLQPGAVNNATGIFATLIAGSYTVNVVDVNGCTNSVSVTVTTPPVLSAAPPVLSNISCNGGSNGSITQTYSGGTGTLTYTLQPGAVSNTTGAFTGLAAGTYTVSVADVNGCTDSTTLALTQPTPLQITSATFTVPSCVPGGDATVTVAAGGGTSPYTYALNAQPFQASGAFANIGNAGNYTVTALDAQGCTVSTMIAVQAPPIPTITNVVSVLATCNPGCDGSLTVTAAGGTTPYAYAVNAQPFQASNALTALCAASYTITVQDALGCTVSSAAAVGTTPPPVLNNVSVTNALCNNAANGSITLAVSGGTPPINYILNPGNVTNTTGVFLNLASGTYTISGTDVNGCTISTITSVGQPITLQFVSGQATPPSCFGGSNGTLTVSTSGGVGSNIYTISPITGTFVAPSSYNGLQGNVTYTVTATDMNGCTATTAVFVPQPTQVTINSMTSTPVTCFGASNGGIQTNASGGTGSLAYTLNPGAQTNATGTFNGLTGLTYTVTASDANGCTATSSTAVFQPTAVTVTSAASTNIVCFGQVNGTVTVSGTGGTGAISYTLNPGAQTNATGSFTALAAAVYTVTLTDANGCTATTTLTVVEPPVVAMNSLLPTNVLCFGQSSGTLTAGASGGVGALTYTLLPNNTSNGTGAFTGLPIGTYTVQVADANNCTASSTATLTQPAPLVAALDSTVDILCHGGNNGLIAGSATGGTFPYLWTLQPNNTNSTAGVFGSLPAGIYSLYVTDQKGCMDSIPAVQLFEPTAIQFITVTHQDIDCYLDSSGSITVTASGGTGTLVFSLLPPAGVQSSPGQFDSLPGGTYTVVVTDANGCTATTSVLVKQNLQIIASDVTLVEPICHGDTNGSITIVAQGGVPPMTYSLNGAPFVSNGSFAPLWSGTHVITVMDAKGCSYDTVLVLTQPDPVGANIKTDGIYCVDQNDARMTVIGTGGRGNYTYYLKPGLFVNKSGIFKDISAGTYTLTIVDQAGCQLDTVVTVNLPDNPLGTVMSHGDIGCYGTGDEGWAKVTAVGGMAPYTYFWHATPVQTTDVAIGLRYGWHAVTVTDARGCSKKDSTYIEPGPCCDEVFIPNAFTPNGDGRNDVWRVVTAAGIDLKQLDIYDRWGNRVWSATDINDAWDGTYRGKNEDMNTFYYFFRYRCLFDGQDYIKKGDVILMR